MEAVVVAVGGAGSFRCSPSHRSSTLLGHPLPPALFLPSRLQSWPVPSLVAMAKQPNWQARHAHASHQVLHRAFSKALQGASTVLVASGAAALVLLQQPASAVAETFTITFPGSRIGEVNAVQRTLVEAWGIVRETYVDPTFNNQGLCRISKDSSLHLSVQNFQ